MRADRLLSLMLLLRARGRMTAQELSAELEVSERTVYRDIDALSSAGVPVYTQPGANGGVFLDEGYRVLLTGLSREQVLSLFASSDVGPLADLGLAGALEGSLLKLFAALPARHRHDVEQMRQRFHIDPADWFSTGTPPYLALLQGAVWDDYCVEIDYQPVEGERRAFVVEAYALVAKVNVWYLVGRREDGEIRSYRLSRLKSARLTGETFARAADFDLAAYWRTACEGFRAQMLQAYPAYPVELLVNPAMFWYLPSFLEGRYDELDMPGADGWRRVRVVFGGIYEAQLHVFALGEGARIVAPVELRDVLCDAARRILALHSA